MTSFESEKPTSHTDDTSISDLNIFHNCEEKLFSVFDRHFGISNWQLLQNLIDALNIIVDNYIQSTGVKEKVRKPTTPLSVEVICDTPCLSMIAASPDKKYSGDNLVITPIDPKLFEVLNEGEKVSTQPLASIVVDGVTPAHLSTEVREGLSRPLDHIAANLITKSFKHFFSGGWRDFRKTHTIRPENQDGSQPPAEILAFFYWLWYLHETAEKELGENEDVIQGGGVLRAVITGTVGGYAFLIGDCNLRIVDSHGITNTLFNSGSAKKAGFLDTILHAAINKTPVDRVQIFCTAYETKIRDLGVVTLGTGVSEKDFWKMLGMNSGERIPFTPDPITETVASNHDTNIIDGAPPDKSIRSISLNLNGIGHIISPIPKDAAAVILASDGLLPDDFIQALWFAAIPLELLMQFPPIVSSMQRGDQTNLDDYLCDKEDKARRILLLSQLLQMNTKPDDISLLVLLPISGTMTSSNLVNRRHAFVIAYLIGQLSYLRIHGDTSEMLEQIWSCWWTSLIKEINPNQEELSILQTMLEVRLKQFIQQYHF